MPVLARLGFWFRDAFAGKKSTSQERYYVEVVSPDPARVDVDHLPIEIQFVMSVHPEWRDKIQALFDRGYGIGIRSIRECPPSLLQAVERIANVSQEHVTEPWLTRLIRDTDIPVFTEDELREHYDLGMNLFDEAHLILEYRHRMKQILLIDLEHHGIEEADRVFVSDMDRALRPVSETYLLHRIHLDRRPRSFRPLRMVLGILFVIGPVAHVLEGWVRGMGHLFAALADDVVFQSAELVSLRQSGFTLRQLWRHGQWLLPVSIIAVFVVLQVEVIRGTSPFFAGFLFGLAASLFPLSDVLRRYAELRSGYRVLMRMGKYPAEERPSLTVLALQELCRHPFIGGSLAGAVLMPFFAGVAFLLFPDAIRNGWFLASVASIDFFIAWLILSISLRGAQGMYAIKVRELMRV